MEQAASAFHIYLQINEFVPPCSSFQAPIKESLILYNDVELNNLSVQSFLSEFRCNLSTTLPSPPLRSLTWACFSVSPTDVMQFMGDKPMKKKITQSDCLSNILMVRDLSLSSLPHVHQCHG